MGFLDAVLEREEKKREPQFKSAFLSAVASQSSPTQLSTTPRSKSLTERLNPIPTALKGAEEGFASVEVPKRSISPMPLVNVEGAKAAGSVLENAFKDFYERAVKAGSADSEKVSFAENITRSAEAGVGLVNLLFSPITGALKGAQHDPIAGPAADLVNRFFGAIGGAGSEVAVKNALNNLPVSDKTKERLTPLVSEIGALVAQLGVAKVGHSAYTRIKGKTTEIVKTIDEDIKVQVKIASEERGTTKIPIKTPSTKQAEYARSMGYEPFTPVEQLPIIRFGSRARTTEPTIRLPAERLGLPRIPGATYEPIKTPAFESQVKGGFLDTVLKTTPERATGAVPEQIVSAERVVREPTAEPYRVAPVEATGPVRTPTLAEKIENLAIEKELVTEFADRPEYAQTNWGEQIQLATDIYKAEPNRALRILSGEEAPPSNVLINAFEVAIEKLAIRAGDTATLKILSDTSALRSTRFGQEIGILSQREQLSPVKIMTDVKKAREEAFEKKTGKSAAKATQEEVTSMKQHIRKNASKRQDWDSFIKEIQCGY